MNKRRSLTYFAPIESIVQMKGLPSSPNPAITGWQKYGPNLNGKEKKDIRSIFYYFFLVIHMYGIISFSTPIILRINTNSHERGGKAVIKETRNNSIVF